MQWESVSISFLLFLLSSLSLPSKPACLEEDEEEEPTKGEGRKGILQMVNRRSSIASSSVQQQAESERNLVSCTIQILRQPLAFLAQSSSAHHASGSIDDVALSHESEIIVGSSPGRHLRHVHDHLRILLDVIQSPEFKSPDPHDLPVVDYDQRSRRRLPELETSCSVALEEFEKLVKRLEESFDGSGTIFGRRLKLRATTPVLVEMETTVGRELWVILTKELGLEIDPCFGVAPSTLVFREWRKNADEPNEPQQGLGETIRARL
ncbi:hypothetical protein IE53DRAFT_363863 [Violaceomyces palustris]|uniref:Uncharacterized protein n=1 Tax=Violaceomyces palustris TaxID=1673888 RepID=A0ACD0NRQ9_9BASI|nr:hypothetical protein IE53DRAFT_363863 [Violaceomyces palustris]